VSTALQADLTAELAASAPGREGVVWSLEAGPDLNVNLVRFGAGGGVGEHVNDEVDVVFVGVSGSGSSRPKAGSTPWTPRSWSSSPRAPGARPGDRPRASPTSPSTAGVDRSTSKPYLKQSRQGGKEWARGAYP
jgi:hypothetical protein